MISENGGSDYSAAAAHSDRVAGPPLSRWQKFRLVVKVVELRLRFIALMAITGLVFAYWDTLWNRYDKWMRPAAEQHAAVSGHRVLLPDAPAGRAGRAGQLPDLRHAAGEAEEGGEGDAARGGHGPRATRPVPRGAGRHQDGRGGLRPADETLTTVGYVAFDERRMANIVSKVPGKIAGREALCQLHRPGCRGRPDPGRALQPRAEPGDPGAAQRGRSAPSSQAQPQSAVGRSLAGRPARDGPRCRPRSSSGGGSLRPRSTRSSRRARPTSRSRSSRRSAATSSRRTSSRARRCRKATRCSRSPTCTPSGSRPRSTSINWAWSTKGRRSRRPSRRFPAKLPGQGRVHPAAPRPGDPHRRGPVRAGQPRPSAPARDVRHGDAQDAGRRHARVPDAAAAAAPRRARDRPA